MSKFVITTEAHPLRYPLRDEDKVDDATGISNLEQGGRVTIPERQSNLPNNNGAGGDNPSSLLQKMVLLPNPAPPRPNQGQGNISNQVPKGGPGYPQTGDEGAVPKHCQISGENQIWTHPGPPLNRHPPGDAMPSCWRHNWGCVFGCIQTCPNSDLSKFDSA